MIKKGQISLYINADNHLTMNQVCDNMFILQSNNILEIIDTIQPIIPNIDIIILDSLPTINDGNGMECNTNKVISGVQKLISICNRNKCDLVIVNQIRYSNKIKLNTYGLRRLILYYNKRIEVKKEEA